MSSNSVGKKRRCRAPDNANPTWDSRMREATRTWKSIAFSFLALVLIPGALPAQEVRDTFPGVRLGLVYEAGFEPALAFKPFTSRFGGGGAEVRVEAIMARDLRYSDRFALMDSIPASLVGEGLDYNLWDQLGATWSQRL